MNEIWYRGKYCFKHICQQKEVGLHRQISARGWFQYFLMNLVWKESTKGTNLQSGLLRYKTSCFCGVVKIPWPASPWNYSKDILAFLLCKEPSLHCCSCSGARSFPSLLQFNLQAASSEGCLLFWEALDAEQLLEKRAGSCALLWTRFRTPLMMGSWSESSQCSYYRGEGGRNLSWARTRGLP